VERHLGEGSFFIGEDATIFQVVDGRAEAVVYGGTQLTARCAEKLTAR
jgi:hypothetical protein